MTRSQSGLCLIIGNTSDRSQLATYDRDLFFTHVGTLTHLAAALECQCDRNNIGPSQSAALQETAHGCFTNVAIHTG